MFWVSEDAGVVVGDGGWVVSVESGVGAMLRTVLDAVLAPLTLADDGNRLLHVQAAFATACPASPDGLVGELLAEWLEEGTNM